MTQTGHEHMFGKPTSKPPHHVKWGEVEKVVGEQTENLEFRKCSCGHTEFRFPWKQGRWGKRPSEWYDC